MQLSRAGLAGMIDHTLLEPTATETAIRELCEQALEHRFGAVCVPPGYVSLASRLLAGRGIEVGTVIGFPLGYATSKVKAAEAADAVASGATEIDMVMNIAAMKSGDIEQVRNDVEAVVRSAGGRVVKVILENCYLTQQEKVAACQMAVEAGAQFVKTSTGFGEGGATVEDVALMRANVPEGFGIKAAGGIRSLEFAWDLIAAGATRIGTSSGVQLLSELEDRAS